MSRCPNCGCDEDRLYRKVVAAERMLKAEASRHAITKAEFDLYRITRADDDAWLQAKVRRQAETIRRQDEAVAALRKALREARPPVGGPTVDLRKGRGGRLKP
jgi:predicted  nucleic acid-binding Zn-ribbon protein